MIIMRYKNFSKFMIITLFAFFIMQVKVYAETMSRNDAIRAFVSAGAAYKHEHYKKAISLYNKIINSGWESGAIYYNLANSYFRNGNIAKAILNYERAKRLISADSDLNYNLKYARSLVPMKVLVPKYNLLHSFIERMSQRYSEDFWVWSMVLSFVVMSILFLLFNYFRLSKRNVYIFTIFMFSLSFFMSLYIFVYKLNKEKRLAVVLKKTDARFEPRLDSTVHFKLYPGLEVNVLKRDGGWAKISREDGKRGWVRRSCIEQITETH